MKAKFDGSYPSKATGTITFRYKVSGTSEELAQFAKIQDKFHRVDDVTGESLWFTVRYVGKSVNLGITRDGKKIYADVSEMQAIESVAQQFPTIGAALAKEAAANMFGSSIPVAATAPVAVEQGLDS